MTFRLENVDARVKMALLILLSTLSVISRSLGETALLLAFAFGFLLLGGMDAKQMYYRLRAALKLLMSLFVLQALFNRTGEALIAIGGVTLMTVGGVYTAALVAMRLFAVMLSALIVLSGDTRDYLQGLIQWHVPYEIAFMIMAGLRFLPSLREEAQDVLYAVEMRGVDLKQLKLKEKLHTYLSLVAPIVARTIHRSEQMSIAMEARAFRSMDRRTSMRRLRMKKSDYVVFAASAAVLILIVVGV